MAKILFIEDNPAVMRPYSFALHHAGYELISEYNCEDGLRTALRESPDVILLDIMMLGMNGIDFLSAVKAEKALAHIPVIAFTNTGSPEVRDRALELGAADWWLKVDIDPLQLVEKLKPYLPQDEQN